METKKTVIKKYSKELEEINQQIELVKEGKSSGIGLINQIKVMVIDAYYNGQHDGILKLYEILKN